MPGTQSQSSGLPESVGNYFRFQTLLRKQGRAVRRLEAYELRLRMQEPSRLTQDLLEKDLRKLVDRRIRLDRLGVGGFLGIGPSEEKLTDFRQSLKKFSHRLYQASVDTGGLNIVEAIEHAGIQHKLVPLFKEQSQAEKRLIEEQQRPWADETPGLTQRFFERELSGCMNRIKRLVDLGAPPANGFAFFEPRADELWALKDRLLTLNSDLSLTAEAFSVNMNEVRQNIGINQMPNEAVPGYTGPSLEYLIYNQVRLPDYSEESRAGEQPTAAEETVSRLRSSVHGSVESDINRSQSLRA